MWIHKGYIEAGYGWSFPAGDEVRVGVGSFEPRHHVKQPTVRLAADLGLPPDGYQGNWIPHAIRPAAADGVFFVGDSAGHCIPLTAEGIRTAFYFGIAAGRELRAVLEGEQSREQALVRYAHFSAERAWKFAWMKRWQDTVWRLRPRARDALVRSMTNRRAAAWAFGHYWRIAPPEFALPAPAAALPRERRRAAGGLGQEAEQQLVEPVGLVELHPVARALDALVAPLRLDLLAGALELRLGQVVVAAAPDAERRHGHGGERGSPSRTFGATLARYQLSAAVSAPGRDRSAR